jgi:predicted HicB family RNase H-like nuclease
MTKQGYTHIIVPKALHEQLKTAAHQKQISIAQLIKQLISMNASTFGTFALAFCHL